MIFLFASCAPALDSLPPPLPSLSPEQLAVKIESSGQDVTLRLKEKCVMLGTGTYSNERGIRMYAGNSGANVAQILNEGIDKVTYGILVRTTLREERSYSVMFWSCPSGDVVDKGKLDVESK